MTVPTVSNCHLVCRGYGLVPNLGTSPSVRKESSKAWVSVGICVPLGILVWKTTPGAGWSGAPDLDFGSCVSSSGTKIWGRGFSGAAEVSRWRIDIHGWWGTYRGLHVCSQQTEQQSVGGDKERLLLPLLIQFPPPRVFVGSKWN